MPDDIEYNLSIAAACIDNHILQVDSQRCFERCVLADIEDLRHESPRSYRFATQLIANMGRIRQDYATLSLSLRYVTEPVIVGIMTSVDKLCALIANKRHRILLKSALKIVKENPAYCRSHHFSASSLIRLASCRSFVDAEFVARWKKLQTHIDLVITRIKIITVTLANLTDLSSLASDTEDEIRLTRSIERRNGLTVTRMTDLTV